MTDEELIRKYGLEGKALDSYENEEQGVVDFVEPMYEQIDVLSALRKAEEIIKKVESQREELQKTLDGVSFSQ